MAARPLAAGRFAAERPAARVTRPLRRFMETEVSSGLVLLAALATAIAWANSPWRASYHALWELEVRGALGPFALAAPLREAVNDGLMVLFFFVVGLEVKRELLRGHLRTVRHAVLPILAALGGMLVPAAVYLAFTAGGPAAHGWGVPMATDIALALGVLTLGGGRVPAALRVLLLGIAIIDDIGAVLVIAVVYSHGFDPAALGAAAALLGVMLALRALQVWYTPIYVVVGCGVWLAVYLSGVHATMAGVVLGLLTPVGALRPGALRDRDPEPEQRDEVPFVSARLLRIRAMAATPVADRLMNLLHPWTSFLVLPVFALANAGVALDREALASAAGSPAALGIVAGLVGGKTLGIVAGCWVARRLGARLPQSVGWRQVAGVGALGGVGFTMSLFIAGLAFEATTLADAKIAIVAASAAAALAGVALVRGRGPRRGRGVPVPAPAGDAS